MQAKINELKPEDLRSECDPKIFNFKTTADIKDADVIINQDRAMKAIDFGLNIKSNGFNLYISGIPATGRNTMVLKKIKKIAEKEPVPEDICYLHNFKNNDEPNVLKLPPKMGSQLKKDMEELIKELEIEIQKAFSGKDYEDKKKEVLAKIRIEKEKISVELENDANSKGFMLQQSLTGLVVIPLKAGKPMKDRDYAKLSENERRNLDNAQKELHEKIHDFSRKIRDIQRRMKNEIEELDKKIVFFTMWLLIDDIKNKYRAYKIIIQHLDNVVKDILDNLSYFKKYESDEQPFIMPAEDSRKNLLTKYKVNLLVDNSLTKGAPVVVEDNPTYYNLIGKIEHIAQMGVLSTNFTMIKPGSVLTANGGYLVLQAMDILKEYFSWEALKKVIKYKKAKIENLSDRYGLIATTTLKPEPVSVDLKVIIIGNPYIYQLFYIYDEDFRKLFKIKADFDTSIKKSKSVLNKYAQLIATKCKEENLLPAKNDAVAELIDYSSRVSEHKEKLTAKFLEVEDILRESNYWAKKDSAKVIKRKHVKKALAEKIYRSNMIESKIQELIKENTIYIDTDGKLAGQINGLAILDMGDYVFGKPSRITAKTFIGKGEVMNIEREIELSGKIHSKGVLILSSYLGYTFAQDKPLTFCGSICFEQLYDEIDGDSASSTELYCLLSSLSEVPLRQDIAVTGSVNQNGEVQPVGGINEKIEGFYKVCKIKGITGKQGVMIPHSNIKHLMLNDEVVKAVKENKFHIYPAKTIKQGIEILTGIKAGTRRKNGKFQKGTINYMVDKKLKKYADLSYKFGKEEK